MTFDIQSLPIKTIHSDPRSANVMSPERFEKLKHNIQTQGCVQPILVRPHPKKRKHYMIVDGHYRIQVLKSLGEVNATCLIVDVDETKSGLLLATLNRLRGEDHPRKRAELIGGLLPNFSQAELAKLLPETEAQLSDLLALLKQEEADIKKCIERHIEAEKSTLPETLTFVLNQAEMTVVKETLTRFDKENPNRALVLLCQFAQDDEQNNDE